MSRESRSFARLLRWYPRSWQRDHGEVLLSSLLDAAEAEGRTRPSAAELRGAMLHGVAARIDRRFALVCALVAVAASVSVGVLMVWAGPAFTVVGGVLSQGVAPVFAALAFAALLRERGLIGDARTLVTMALATGALALGVVATGAWSLGFDAADEGMPATGLAAVWAPLLLAGIVVGAATVAVVLDAVFARTSLPTAARVVLASLAGLIAAALTGLALLQPVVSALIAFGAATAALLVRTRGAMPPAAAGRAPAARRSGVQAPTASTLGRRRTARTLAILATTGGALGVVYALTGPAWAPAAADGTVAIAQGVTILLVSGVPLLAAIGLRAAATRTGALHVWGPLALVALGMVLVGVAYQSAPSWNAMAPGLQGSAVAVGAALGWCVARRMRRRPAASVILGLAAAGLYAVFLGVMLAPMLAFAVPLVALVYALLPVRPRAATASRPEHPALEPRVARESTA